MANTQVKKTTAFLSVVAMVLSMLLYFPSGTFGDIDIGLKASAATITPAQPSGDGTSDSPYKIRTAAELYWFADKVNNDNGTYGSANAVLTADITVNSNLLGSLAYDADGNVTNGNSFTSWSPIGWHDYGTHVEYSYNGTFDGQNHTISGLYFNDASTNDAGLFGCNNGTVKNAGIVDSYFNGDLYVGGVCGYNDGKIENCYNTGKVSGTNKVGGVCGVNSGRSTNCYNTGTVSGYSDVGGVCGENSDSITSSFNTGDVSGNSWVGGVCGDNSSSGTITSCYSTGNVSGQSDVGGVCGYNSSSGTITSCYFDSDKHSGDAVGGDSGTVTEVEGKTTGQFNSGEVAYLFSMGIGGSVWGQEIGTDPYPVLGGAKVYVGSNCTGYSNTENYNRNHHYENGVCTICGASQAAVFNNTNNCYEISNAYQLYWFAGLVNGDPDICKGDVQQNAAANAVLTADITVNTGVLKSDGTLADDTSSFTSWTPIGWCDNDTREKCPYTGTFDGQNHTISGLYFQDTSIHYVGLFGYIKTGGTVKNVGVVDSYFDGQCFVGGVCGYNYSGSITNCYNTGTVRANDLTNLLDYAGGVCGYNVSDTITNCYNAGAVTATGNVSLGGVCGYNDGTITNCYFDSDKYSGNAVGDGSGTATDVEGKTTEQFASGEVAFLLQGSRTEAVWGQEIGTDPYPVLGGAKVYVGSNCTGYSNTENYNRNHHYENGVCTICGASQAAVFNNTNNCYEISNADQLYWFAGLVNGDPDICKDDVLQNAAANAVLMDDITVNQNVLVNGELNPKLVNPKDWALIGYFNSNSDYIKYTGTFDGQNHTISGLYFNKTNSTTGKYVGLFGYIGTGGSVKNVGVVDSHFNGYQYVGGVCGNNYGTITNCYNTGKVCGSNSVGGVCGSNNGWIIDSYNTGTVSGNTGVGGVCGLNKGIIENSYNTGKVCGSSSVGGVCGYNNNGTITNCYNTGTVSVSGTTSVYVGGVCGYISFGTITNCYNTGTVSVSGTTSVYVGGVCGVNSGRSTNCYNTGTVSVSGTTSVYVGGVCGYNVSDTITNCYNAGAVTATGNVSLGGVCGYNSSSGTITNCYFDSTVYIGNAVGAENATDTTAEGKPTAGFQSGEVAYLLAEGDNGSVWGQKIGTDAYPVLDGTKKVYQIDVYAGCKGNPGTASKGYSNTNAPVYAVHNMTEHTANAASCTNSGNYAYWTCSHENGVYYKDEAGTETFANFAATVIPAHGHDMTEHPANAATCTNPGNYAYWTCSREDGVYYKDEAGTDTFENLEVTAIPAFEHDYTSAGICKICAALENGKDGFKSVSLTLTDGVLLNYYLLLSEEALADTGAYIHFTSAQGLDVIIMLSEGTEDNGKYKFSLALRPDQMAEVITAQVVYSDGSTGNSVNYSVQQYGENVTEADSSKALVDAMLKYGAYTQLYTGENTDNLAVSVGDYTVNASIDESYQYTLDSNAAGISLTGATLQIGAYTTIRLKFQLEEGADIDNYTFQCGDTVLTPEKSGAFYYVYLRNIRPQDLDEMYSFTVSDGTNTITFTYSAFTYMKNVLDNADAYDQTLVNLINAMYDYHQAAEAYLIG